MLPVVRLTRPGRRRPRVPSLLLAALGLLAGCATERWIYTKAGVSPATLDHDLGACRRLAHRPYTFALTQSRRVDLDELNQCMERKGYTVRPDQ